jgi:YHS domain-containing protein
MSALQELEQRINDHFAAAHRQNRSVPSRPQPSLVACQRFGETADRLLREVICPRVEKLVTHFDNAELLEPDEADHRYSCLCRFRATSRFPATARLEVILTHDEQVEHLLVLYRLEIGPTYVPFKGEVQVVFPIDKVDEEQLVRWMDDQIVDFVEAYLCFEFGWVRPDLVVDPVCGMVLNQQCVAAQSEYRGKTYYFCVDNCRKKFAQDPERYLVAPQTNLAR